MKEKRLYKMKDLFAFSKIVQANATRNQLKKTLGGLSVALGFDQFKLEKQECIAVTVSYIRNWRIIHKRFDVYRLSDDDYDTDLMKQRVEKK
uniref:Type II toxin-antitoxin system RelE/ParE family toxin n=1 Tax=Panagrellus redivivus TaxID=6233 RepID=A0A7E4VAD6_PANRE